MLNSTVKFTEQVDIVTKRLVSPGFDQVVELLGLVLRTG